MKQADRCAWHDKKERLGVKVAPAATGDDAMVEPVTGGLIAGGLLSTAAGLLGTAADLQGLRTGRLLKRLVDRFEAAPNDAQVFYAAIWQAAVRATHGCVQQVYDHTATTDDVRGDTPSWDRFRDAHARVRKVREWSDAPTLPQVLQDALTRDLAHTLHAQTEPDDAGPPSAAQAVWASYSIALRDAGIQGEPPAVIRQAFFGERPEAKVWPWSRHFALRIGEQLRDNTGFKAMFDAAQFAGIGSCVAQLIADFADVEQVLAEMSGKLDAVQGIAERTEQNTLKLRDDNQQMMDMLRDIQSRLPLGAIGLNEEIERLRQRPDIHLEDLVGWLQTALNRSDPLSPDALPRLLQQALTIDLPKLRTEAERYRLDPLASPEAQALLDEVRALLHPQAGTPLDLQAASEKLRALDDRVVAERTARRRDEDRELAQLRVLRAEAERAMAHHATAAELMEQAAGLCHDDTQARAWNEQAAEDWFNHGMLHPGVDALHSAVRLLTTLLESSERGAAYARICSNLGVVQSELGVRMDGAQGLQSLYVARTYLLAALEIYSPRDMPMDWAMAHHNLGTVQRNLGERLEGEPSMQALLAAERSYQAALEIFTFREKPKQWAMTKNNLGNLRRNLAERVEGEARLQLLHAAETELEESLLVHTFSNMPTEWALSRDNLGAVLLALGEYLDGDVSLESLREAKIHHETALLAFTREHTPVRWAMARNNLGVAQQALGERLRGDASFEELRAAKESYQAVLEVFTPEEMPLYFSVVTQNLVEVEKLLAKRAG